MPILVIQTDGAVDVAGDNGFSFRLMARDVLKIHGGMCPGWINSDVCERIRRILRGLCGKIIVVKIIGLSARRVEKACCNSIEVYCDGTVKFTCVKDGKKAHLMSTLSYC